LPKYIKETIGNRHLHGRWNIADASRDQKRSHDRQILELCICNMAVQISSCNHLCNIQCKPNIS